MGVAERRLREKEQRRESIIRAAERVFFSKGVEAATMDEVAVAAEISKGLLYLYFKSKEDLYNAVCLAGLRMLRRSFQRAVRSQMKGLKQIHAIGLAYVAFSRQHPNHFSMIVFQAAQERTDEPDSYAAACKAERDAILRIVADTIRRGIEDGSIRSDIDPVQAALMLWGQMHGVIQVAVLENIQKYYEVDFDDLMQFTFGFVTDGLRPR